MKFKTTRKAIVEGTARQDLLSVGYCGLSTLLRNHSPVAYTCGVYGWNFDVYQVYGKTICTGYRNMPGRRANNAAEYEAKACEILDKAINSLAPRDWNKVNKVNSDIEALLKEFCEQA